MSHPKKAFKLAIKQALDAFGGVNVAINCAGVADPAKNHFEKRTDAPLAFFNRMLQINLVGTFNVARLAIEQMVKNAANEDGEKGSDRQHVVSRRL